MPIKINLLAEQLDEVEARRKDPVKRTIWGAGTVVGLFVLFLILGQTSFWKKRSNLNNLDKELEALQPRIDASSNQWNEVINIEGKINNLDRYITNRFQWTLPLNALQFSTLPKIKVTSFEARQYFTNSIAKVDTGSFPIAQKAVNEKWFASDNPIAEIKKEFERKLEERINNDPLLKTNRSFLTMKEVKTPIFSKMTGQYVSSFNVTKPAYTIRFIEFTIRGRDLTESGSQFKAFRDKIFNNSYFKETVEESDNLSITENSISKEVDYSNPEEPPSYRFTLFCKYPLDYKFNK
jgi:hypothetical protein